MTSEEQLQANKENAQLSTGPKTDEGRAISKLNALKHGILSKEVLLQGEDEGTLVELGSRLRDELRPIGEMELILVERITTNVWRLRRSLEAEKALMEYERFYPSSDINFGFERKDEELKQKQEKRRKIKNMVINKGIEIMTRYETTIERSIYKALHELQRLQSARFGEKPPAPLAIDIDVSKDE